MILAWRAVTPTRSFITRSRPLSLPSSPRLTARINLPLRRAQFYHAPPPPTRSPTLLSKVWFRKDGRPRSRIKGLFIAFLTTGILFSTYTLIELAQQLDTANHALERLVDIQRMYFDYDSLDRDDARAVRAWFEDMCKEFWEVPDEARQAFFEDVGRLPRGVVRRRREKWRKEGGSEFERESDGSRHVEEKGEEEGEAERAEGIMKTAVERVYTLLRDGKGKDPWEVAGDVIWVLDEALVGLVEIVEEHFAESEGEPVVLSTKAVRERLAKDDLERGGGGVKSNEYEIVG